MRVGRRGILGLGAWAMSAGVAVAGTEVQNDPPSPPQEIIPLWPKGPPGGVPPGLAEREEERAVAPGHDRVLTGIVQPRLEVYRPAPAADRRRAMLIIPGGGYQRLAMDKEGRGMARYLAARGVTACVLIHRMPAEGWSAGADAPLQDAQRAMRVIRSRAEGWAVDSARVGLVGFSAGGHLGGMLATRHSAPVYAPGDEIDALSARPFEAGLIYPVISMDAAVAHKGSRAHLLGDQPSAERIAAYSVDRQVSADTPPCFLVHAADDPVVPVANSLLMFQALQAARVRSELHIFEDGGHGFGLTIKTTARAWMGLFMDWRRA